MREIFFFLQQKLPAELCWSIMTFSHDLKPILKELLEKHPKKIPQMIIKTNTLLNLRRLITCYGKNVHAVSCDLKMRRFKYSVEVGCTDSLSKVRLYKYLRQRRWNSRQEAWREIGVNVSV